MISEQDKQAILNGAYGVTRDGQKAKFLGKNDSSNHVWWCFYTDEGLVIDFKPFQNMFEYKENIQVHFDVIGVWQDKPKPFDLARALSGESVMLRDGIFGKGIQDIPNAQRDPLYKKAYSRWYNMLQRCYSANFHKNSPTYVNVTMCEDWLIFSNFYYWLTSFDNWENLEIDKDLLSGNYYSPETCLLLPKNLNTFLTFSQKTNTNMIGVNYYTPKGQKEGVFRATISVKYKGKPSNKHLGHFSTPLEGHLAWLSAKISQLDEYILVSVGNVKTILQSLRDFMNNCLINKSEFCGLEHFRNNHSKIGMWKDPKPQLSSNSLQLPKPISHFENTEHLVYMLSADVFTGEFKAKEVKAFNREASMLTNGRYYNSKQDVIKVIETITGKPYEDR